MKNARVVEMVLFELNEGVSVEEGKQAMKALDEFVSQMPGFISRKLSVNEEGQFLDLVFWTDLASAKKASEEVMKREDMVKHFSVINQETMTFKHFDVIHSLN